MRGSLRRRRFAALLVPLVLGACSAADGSSLGSGLVPPGEVAGGSAQQQPAAEVAAIAPSAGVSKAGPVQFLPLVGAPPEKVALLSQALGKNAARLGVTIIPASEPTAPLRLKGYLSALTEGQETVIVYVWDIVDPQGTRVSRIQGQQRIGGTAADPWSVVDERAFDAIAAETLTRFRQSLPAAG